MNKYEVGQTVYNKLSNSIGVIISMSSNHNGDHFQTVNIANGNISSQNNTASKCSQNNITILHQNMDELIAQQINIPNWIMSKIDELIED